MCNYRKIIYSIPILALLASCSNSEVNGENALGPNYSKQQLENASLPNAVSSSKITGEKLSEDDIKKSTQNYLNTNEEIYKVISPIQDKVWNQQKLTKRETDQLEEGCKLLDDNQQQFKNYITSNKLPEDYDEELERLSDFVGEYNRILNEMSTDINKIEEKIKTGKVPTKEIKSIIPNSEKLNGKQQEKIESFLKDRKINVEMFNI